jgi:hypothetical protein
MSESTADRLAKVHATAIAEFNKVQTAAYPERQRCLQDRRFCHIAGAQWEGPIGELFEHKPMYELNKPHLAVMRVINEHRNNQVQVLFTPKDGTKDDKTADVCAGLLRADEQDSNASEAYNTAFEEGVTGGMGAWRLRAELEDEDDDENEDQRVCIEPIYDADSCVFFSSDGLRQDKADASRCWVLSAMTRETYMEEYEDDPSTWPKLVTNAYFDWARPDLVYIAEYYVKEKKTEITHYFRGIAPGGEDEAVLHADLQDDGQTLSDLTARGMREVRVKKRKVTKVHKYVMSGGGVLSDEGYIAGKHIPIVPYYGKRSVVDGVERCMGHVRLAKDATRINNMLMSKLVEIAAKFGIEKPIFTPQQVVGHTTRWSDDNIEDYPFMLVNPVTDASGQQVPTGPIGYTRAPNIPPAMAALMQIAEASLQDLLGNQAAGEQIQPNLSGVAVELIQNRLDMQTFIYLDNFKLSMQRSGTIWLSMMKDIAGDAKRKMKTIAKDGSVASITLNDPAHDVGTGEDYIENDLSSSNFDVVATVAPSSGSQRSAVVRALTGVASITEDPETKQALMLATISNIEGEGLTDLRDWARAKSIRIGTIKPTDEETKTMQAEQQNQKPDPQAEYLEAEAAAARASTLEKVANAHLKDAQTTKVLAEVNQAGGPTV